MGLIILPIPHDDCENSMRQGIHGSQNNAWIIVSAIEVLSGYDACQWVLATLDRIFRSHTSVAMVSFVVECYNVI